MIDQLNVVSDVYDFAIMATASSLREAMTSARRRLTPTAALALRSVASAFQSNIQGAISLLRRGLLNAPRDHEDSAYLRDMLLTLLASTGELDAAERLVGDGVALPARHAPAFVASRAVLAAATGDRARSRTLAEAAIAAARRADWPLTLGRVLHRCAFASYYRGDYGEAREIALEALHVLEAHGAYVSVVHTHSIAAAIAHDWNQDGTLASTHYAQMLAHAERIGHNALRRTALAGSFLVAAEAYDVPACDRFGPKLAARLEREQHQENFALLIAEVLCFASKADFRAAEATLTMFAATSCNTDARATLVEAFLALVAAANWDVDLARERSRSVLRRTAEHTQGEPLFDKRTRGLARVLGAATCFIIDDRIRGQRALSARFDPGQHYLALLTAPSIELSRCPDLFRGYAAFINAAAESARRIRPKYRLTSAELQILRALPDGSTIAELALELHKSKSTVAHQVESIYEKLGARNRAHAVKVARDLAIM